MPQLAEGTEFAGCRIEGVIGRGGMGVVYRATQLGLGRPVALKVLAHGAAADAELRARFEREWRMAAAIDHPNIVPVYAAGEEDGTPYLVLRLIDGTDLHRRLREQGPLEPERAASVVAQIASALDAAHAAGLVHRDVKPGNILLEGDRAYLGDFGLTRLAEAATQLTQEGRWIGTAGYASPEQLEGRPADARSDVYSLGCVLYAALTGGPPYPRDTVPATLLAHLHDPPPRPSRHGAPPELDRVVARALAKDPADRYPSAGDLGRAAVAAARGEPVTEGERSVASGPAASGDAAGSTPPAGAPPRAAPPDGAEETGERDVAEATRRVAEPAPTRVVPALQSDDASAAPTRVAPGPEPDDRSVAPTRIGPMPDERPAGRVRVHGRRRGLALLAVALLAAVGLGLGAAALFGDGGEAPPAGPLTDREVRTVVGRFARAYATEDGRALARTLTRDVERVLPGGRQRGRAAVVAEYRAQFAGLDVRDYRLEALAVSGGDVGRAAGRYVVDRSGAASFGGRITFLVVRDSAGRPRIDLIAARPDA